jgi:hypothetical protein
MAIVALSRQRISNDGSEGVMGSAWKTKYGMRRVRVDLPTLEEALFAAAGMTPSVPEQIDLAADLMRLPVDQVRIEAVRILQRSGQTHATRSKAMSAPFTVERKRLRSSLSSSAYARNGR